MSSSATVNPAGRRFSFQCLRCRSLLEASTDQAGGRGRCPSCSAEFTIPAFDPHSGLATANADPGEDGELPAPVHAYAAAGANAPRLVRVSDTELMIECPRCRTRTEVTANACSACGLPFTIDGMSGHAAIYASDADARSLWLSAIALPLAFLPIIGLLPAGAALIFSMVELLRKRASSYAQFPVVIAAIAFLIALAVSLAA